MKIVHNYRTLCNSLQHSTTLYNTPQHSTTVWDKLNNNSTQLFETCQHLSKPFKTVQHCSVLNSQKLFRNNCPTNTSQLDKLFQMLTTLWTHKRFLSNFFLLKQNF